MGYSSILRSGALAIAFVVSMFAIGFGLIVADDYTKERNIYGLYKNTSCLITGHKLVNYNRDACDSTSGRAAAGVTRNGNYNNFFLSYLIWNGTLVNGTATTEISSEQDQFREIGSHHECFYNPEDITKVRLEVTDGESHLIVIYACFAISVGIWGLVLALVAGLWIIRKIKENWNDSNQHTPIRMKMLTSREKEENANETTYVQDK